MPTSIPSPSLSFVTRAAVILWGAGCASSSSSSPEGSPEGAPRTLVLAAYTTPREVLAEQILPAFQASWREKTGEVVQFETTYQGSGSQARAVAGGLEADVVWLSLAPDVEVLVEAGLITRDWQSGETRGIVSSSVAVVGVRPDNPHNIQGWEDLARPGLEVLTPNVRTSGGAMWNVLAVAGADISAGETLLSGVLANVRVMDKGARESMLSFEKGVGDAIITYENEVIVAQRAGKSMAYVIPASTIVIENPAAVVDVYAARHGTLDLAEAFVSFLTEPAQQAAMAQYGLRPVVAGVEAAGFPALGRTFRVSDLGGWSAVKAAYFAEGALYDRALARARAVP